MRPAVSALFERPGRAFVERWAGGERVGENSFTTPYPVYPDDVVVFFQLAGQPCWSDYGYEPREAQRLLADDAFIATASLEQVKTMLTYCVRSERFGDGNWGALLESGRVVVLLRRLQALRDGRLANQPPNKLTNKPTDKPLNPT